MIILSQAGGNTDDNGTAEASYTILPDGTIIQWGTSPIISGTGRYTFRFPIPFKKYVSGIALTRVTAIPPRSAYNLPAVDWDSLSLSSFTANYYLFAGDGNNRISWIAIGR